MRFSLAAYLEPAPIPPAVTSAGSKASKANAGQTSPVSLSRRELCGEIYNIYIHIYNGTRARTFDVERRLIFSHTSRVHMKERCVLFACPSSRTAAAAGILYKCQIPSSHVCTCVYVCARVYVCVWFPREKFYRRTGREPIELEKSIRPALLSAHILFILLGARESQKMVF